MKEFVNLTIDEKFIDEAIMQEVYIQSGHKTTICVLILNTGFEVVGSFTGTVAPADIKEGKDKARKEALSKVEEYFIQLNSWRFAIYNSEKALQEQQAAQQAAMLEAEENKTAQARTKENIPTPRKKRGPKKV